jgi:hypothetical protein
MVATQVEPLIECNDQSIQAAAMLDVYQWNTADIPVAQV